MQRGFPTGDLDVQQAAPRRWKDSSADKERYSLQCWRRWKRRARPPFADMHLVPRAFRRDADHVALERFSDGAFNYAFLAQFHAHERVDETHVPAAVSVPHAAGQRILR